jgi:hypothetical protein
LQTRRLCTLPLCVCGELIGQCTATTSADHVSFSAFSRRDPTAVFTLKDIAWREELRIMTSLTGTANHRGFGAPLSSWLWVLPPLSDEFHRPASFWSK